MEQAAQKMQRAKEPTKSLAHRFLTNVLRAIDGVQKENSKQRDSHVGGSNRNKAYRMGSKRDKEHKTGCVQRAHGCVEKEHVCMRRLGMAKGGRGYSSLNRG